MHGPEIFVPIALFASIVLIIYFIVRRKERLALIEKGMDAGIFKDEEASGNSSLKYGILLIGLAIGSFIGYVLDEYAGMSEEVAYFSMLTLFGGISLLIFHFIAKKEN